MRLWYLSHRRPAKAQASLRIRAVSPEPSLFLHMKYGSRRKTKNPTSSTTGWLRMRVWRMNLRRTESTIINDSNAELAGDSKGLTVRCLHVRCIDVGAKKLPLEQYLTNSFSFDFNQVQL